MRVALVHDWLTGMRGGERVLSHACRMFPDADLYTLIRVPGVTDEHIERMRIRTSPLSQLPGVRRYYRHLLPLMPAAIRAFDLSDYDLTISFSHCVAKGFRRDPAATHVCYCFTPMRYVWVDVGDESRGGLAQAGLRMLSPWLRRWDLRSAGNVDVFAANSANTAGRIRRCYGREAEVVYSPVETDFYTPPAAGASREDWYLVVSALTPYKRVEDAVRACGETGRRLKVIGQGPERAKLEAMARGYPGVEMLGALSDEQVRDHYRRCRGVLVPQEEDFGLVPLEAMACGAPVVAYGAGGALETVVDGVTGVLYTPQSPVGLAGGIDRLEGYVGGWDEGRLVRHARGFGPDVFVRGFGAVIDRALERKGAGRAGVGGGGREVQERTC